MSEIIFDSAANQPRIKSILTGLTYIVFHPQVSKIIHTHAPKREDLGWGLASYRFGDNFLASTPSFPGEVPAEINFYPEVAALELKGGIYWHGEGSNHRLKGTLVGFYLGNEVVDGNYKNFMEISRCSGGLVLGRTDKGNNVVVPPSETLVAETEARLDALLDHVRTL